MMAYLVGPRFFVGAVWMSVTGVLMVRTLDYSYLIHGISWFLALGTIGTTLEILRRRKAAENRHPVVFAIAVEVAQRRRRSGHSSSPFADRA